MTERNVTSETLLVLDDTPDIAELIGDLGRAAGFEAIVTTDIETFNRAIEHAAPDVIALDLQMPNTDGIEILRQLSTIGCEARILLISGVDEQTVRGAERLGRQLKLNMLGVQSKPFEPEALIARLRSARALTADLTSEDLGAAMQTANLVLRYQPVVRQLKRGSWHAESVEALPRWQHPDFGLLTPAQFLPLIGSERSAMMRRFTDFVLHHGVEQLRQWQESGLHLGLRVNIPAIFISDTEFPNRLERMFEEFGTDPELLTLELGNTISLAGSQDAVEILTRLRLKGFRLALDDFGGAGLDLQSVYRLPVSEIKIDPTVTADLVSERGAVMVYEGLIALSKQLHIECCAEGVETSEQFSILDDLGCELVQGYYIGMPMPARQIPKALASWTASGKPEARASQ